MTPAERLAAKRANEGVKILATFFNNLAVGTLVAGFLSPLVSGRPTPAWVDGALISSPRAYIEPRRLLCDASSSARTSMDWSLLFFPIGAVIVGAIGFGYAWLQSRAFDRRWGHH